MSATPIARVTDADRANAAAAASISAIRLRKRRRRLLVHLIQLLLVLASLGLWELGSRTGFLSPFFFSRPSSIAIEVWHETATGSIFTDLAVTLEEAVLGLLIGVASGIAVGALLAQIDLLAEVVEPFIRVANSLPRLVFAPLFLLWFGLGTWSKVWMAVSLVFFLVFFNTFQGMRDVDRVLVDNARMLGASQQQLLRHVYLPSALTWIFSSLHVSVGFAIIGAVVGEYLGSSRGIGYLIAQSQGSFNTTGVFAGLTVLAIMVAIIEFAVGRAEKYLLRWKPPISPTSQGSQ